MKTTPVIHLAIAEDHAMFRRSMINLLSQNKVFEIVIEAGNGKDLIEKIHYADKIPEICLLDISMPVMNGYETANELQTRWPKIKILVLTMIKEEYAIIRMLRTGAMGYVLKASQPEELEKAIFEIYNNRYYSSEALSNSILQAVALNKEEKSLKISDKEMYLLKSYCRGLENKDIAKDMDVSVRTVEGYRNSLFEKLDIHSKTDLVIWALRAGIVSIN